MHPALQTELSERFGVRYPIIQTAMGWVATPELVAATANAGAMGFLACAVLRPAEAERAIVRVKELTDRPFGVNFLMEQPGADDIADLVVRYGVKAASYSRSPKKSYVEKFKAAGVLCVPTVGQVKHAVKAVELGADMIVCQGGEGGGHTGSVPTRCCCRRSSMRSTCRWPQRAVSTMDAGWRLRSPGAPRVSPWALASC